MKENTDNMPLVYKKLFETLDDIKKLTDSIEEKVDRLVEKSYQNKKNRSK
jgi:hypothetical protein